MFGEINEKERLENLRLEISLEQERLWVSIRISFYLRGFQSLKFKQSAIYDSVVLNWIVSKKWVRTRLRLLNVFHKYGAMAVIFDDGQYVTPDPEPEAIPGKFINT